jgi:hypothetical protein
MTSEKCEVLVPFGQHGGRVVCGEPRPCRFHVRGMVCKQCGQTTKLAMDAHLVICVRKSRDPRQSDKR